MQPLAGHVGQTGLSCICPGSYFCTWIQRQTPALQHYPLSVPLNTPFLWNTLNLSTWLGLLSWLSSFTALGGFPSQSRSWSPDNGLQGPAWSPTWILQPPLPLSPHSVHSDPSLLVPKHAKHTAASGPLHVLFSLLGTVPPDTCMAHSFTLAFSVQSHQAFPEDLV